MKIRLAALLAAVLTLTGAGVATAGDAPGKPAMKKGTAPAAATTQNLGSYARVTGYTYTVAPGGFSSSSAYCPYGMKVLGGGESNTDTGGLVLTDSYPAYDTYWTVFVKNNGPNVVSYTPWAICGT